MDGGSEEPRGGRRGEEAQNGVSKNWKELQRTEEKIFVKCRERNKKLAGEW